MSNRLRFTLGALWLAMIAAAGYEARIMLRQRAESGALRRRAGQLDSEMKTLRRESDATIRELAQAERQLAALPRSIMDDASAERRAEMNAWLARMKRLQRLLADRPDQRIPELALLNDQDWLRIAKRNALDSEEGIRKALADVRSVAMERFTSMLTPALQKFARAAAAKSGADISSLLAYSDQPIDPTMLARYELTRTSPTSGLSGFEWLVRNKAAIDPDYETRQEITASANGGYGSGSSSGLWAWVPGFRERYRGAGEAYQRDHNGTVPSGIAELLPYFNPPLEPALAAKLIKAEQERTP